MERPAVVVQLTPTRHAFGFGDLLLKIRNTRGWSREDLANRAQIAVTTLAAYETGADPTLSHLFTLSRALHADLWSAYVDLEERRPAKCELLPFQDQKHG